MSYQRYQRGKEQHTTANVNDEGKNEFLEKKKKQTKWREGYSQKTILELDSSQNIDSNGYYVIGLSHVMS